MLFAYLLLPQDTRIAKRHEVKTLEAVMDLANREKERVEQCAAILLANKKTDETQEPAEVSAPVSRIFGSGAQ